MQSDMFRSSYGEVFAGDERWNGLEVPTGDRFAWDDASTYVRNPPYFEGMPREPVPVHRHRGRARARGARRLGHHRPHLTGGRDQGDSPAGRYLIEHGVQPRDFNSYGSRRGNHEVMMRGTFAQHPPAQPPRARHRGRRDAPPGRTGDPEEMTIYDAAMRYAEEGVPLVVLAGKEYGSGSSRDWAAKGTMLLGVRAVIAESFERIHRSNLVGMGVLPLQFAEGESVESLGLTGRETFSVAGAGDGSAREVTVRADEKEFRVRVRIDTPKEAEYFRHGGILPYVLRQLLASG